MTATNHLLVGALLGAVLPLPVAIPAAFMSHFVLDKIPHYGIEDNKRNGSWSYKSVVLIDIVLSLSLVAVMIGLQKWSMLIAGMFAYLPDATFVHYYFTHNHNLNIKPTNGFMKFHIGMQHERPWGILPELIVATTAGSAVFAYLVSN